MPRINQSMNHKLSTGSRKQITFVVCVRRIWYCRPSPTLIRAGIVLLTLIVFHCISFAHLCISWERNCWCALCTTQKCSISQCQQSMGVSICPFLGNRVFFFGLLTASCKTSPPISHPRTWHVKHLMRSLHDMCECRQNQLKMQMTLHLHWLVRIWSGSLGVKAT